jgi:DNA-directed RNA polymerase specialized sigma24 family protein
MFPPRKLETAGFRACYAKRADFCEVFERDMKPLYLLAFLLTANHKEAEQCFVSTVEEAFKETVVFKDWARSWVKRCLIKSVIRIVSPMSTRGGEKRDFWGVVQHATDGESEVDTATQLAPLERFVFVMSILERYSSWDCSLLLGCSVKKVSLAQMRAWRLLSEASTFFLPGVEAGQSPRPQVTA